MNYCFINPDGGSISIEIIAEGGIRTSGTFLLYEFINNEWVKKESDRHETTTDDDGVDGFTLNEPTELLNKDALVWVINGCQQIPAGENGILRIHFYQDGNRCKTSSPTTYYDDYPQCSAGQMRRRGSQVVFQFLHPLENNDLWREVD